MNPFPTIFTSRYYHLYEQGSYISLKSCKHEKFHGLHFVFNQEIWAARRHVRNVRWHLPSLHFKVGVDFKFKLRSRRWWYKPVMSQSRVKVSPCTVN